VCDDCKGLFRTSKIIDKRISKNQFINIYCPYCNGIFNHEKEFIDKKSHQSKRGEMYLHFGKKYIENETITK